ncbi:GNAT family N-acetyltransferase [Virgibacillus salexigens]|uniref:GNAT family N-acetyltransferase n=1 Tax=Virgibacillus TaxID=84406 RepID=UPI001EEFEF93|nr:MULTISPECIES: N-acetyltransferase [Virgibacillus]
MRKITKIIGHILLTKVQIHDDNHSYQGLALAPVSVLPAYQNQGVGSALINNTLQTAQQLNHAVVIVMGHATYYPRFGFEPASKYNIAAPYE